MMRRLSDPFACHRVLWVCLCVALTACAGVAPVPVGPAPAGGTPPAALLGSFVDDHGSRHVVTDTTWQHGRSVYRIEAWDPAGRRLLLTAPATAATDPATDPTRVWLRIDWVMLADGGGADPGAPPWPWAYCMAVWNARSSAEALGAPDSRRNEPLTGCGRAYPFTRMRPDAG